VDQDTVRVKTTQPRRTDLLLKGQERTEPGHTDSGGYQLSSTHSCRSSFNIGMSAIQPSNRHSE
jgi:hypothetical protein